MKNWKKITFGVIGGIVLLFVIDLICIFTINRPLFAIQMKTPGSYSGIFYNVYDCSEYSTPQIKSKRTKFTCAIGKENLIVKEIVDTTKDIKDFSCAEALDGFYSDEKYTYYWSCIKNKYMIVKYENGFEEKVSDALKNGAIKITDLDRFDISYIKEENKITLEDINDKINNYFSKENNDTENLSHHYVDTENNKVVVGLAGNTKEEQEKFINNVFSECCGSKYIKHIKDNSMIEFVEAKYTFEAKIIEAKENEIIVKVLKTTKQLKKDDKVRMKITRPTNGTNDFYIVENNLKITAKGMILTSNPAQIDVIDIELIN